MSTILIVDDVSANRKFLSTILRHHGHRIVEAADGSEGLAATRAEHPDLVITDVLMPVLDGFGFVKQLRLDPSIAATPVVFYTAQYSEREARELARSGGVSDVLTKPAGSADVLRVVDRLLAGGSAAGRRPASSPVGAEFDSEHLRLLTDKLSATAEDLKTANARLRGLINIGLEFAAGLDSPDRLQQLCASVCDLFGATYVTLGILDRDDRTVQRVVVGGADAVTGIAPGDAVPGILRTVVSDRRTVHGENTSGSPDTLHLPAIHSHVEAFLAAPVASPANVYGWLCLVGNEGRPFTDDDEQLVLALTGQVGRIYELEREIVERQRTADTLRRAEERMRFALEAAAIGIWDMDYTTGVLGWSPILEGQYGHLPGTFRGTFDAFIERVYPDDRQAVVGTINEAMARGADFSTEHRSLGADGTVRWLRGAGRILLGGDGRPVRGVGISQDVTERRTLEAQYQQAQKMEAVGRLAGGVAHDFNNLLTEVLGYCELVLADMDPGDRHRADICEIQKAGASAARVTRQLLAFSRKEIIEPTALDLNAILADMQAMLERLIGEDVTVVLRLDPTLSSVRADRGQMEQIIMNLAGNARDAMPRGGTLTIETANATTAEPSVVLSVTDTGVGMTAEVRDHLFEPFFTTKEAGQGTGLGLATVDGIVTRSGGRITVDSEPGRGTCFRVYLPVDGSEIVAIEPPSRAEATSRARGETVMVVEDLEGLRELTRRLLMRQGYTVVVAASAEDAVREFDANDGIDVVLTDVVMPGASGAELATQLATRRPGIKVIYMSGYTDDAIVHHGVIKPGIAFLHKPFTAEALGQKIRDVLDNQVV